MKDKRICVTGGSGSLGQALVSELLLGWSPERIVVYSRSEHPQVEMERMWHPSKYPIRYFLGDVRDKDRLRLAFRNIDLVIHAAALKHVDLCYRNPQETLTVNVLGTMNVVDVALEMNVEKVLVVSTDKAVSPIGLYGSCKCVGDHYTLSTAGYSAYTDLAVVRWGNFENSRGSVWPYFQGLVNNGVRELPVTDLGATRYFVTLEDAARTTLEILDSMENGGLYLPKMEATNVADMAQKKFPQCKLLETGLRQDERRHELLLTGYESKVYECDKWYLSIDSDIEGNLLEQGTRVSSSG